MTISDISSRINTLANYLDRVDVVGYACGRNYSIFVKELESFKVFKENLLLQYGHEVTDEFGNKTGTYVLDDTDSNFNMAAKEYEKVLSLERDIDIIKVKYDSIIGLISGNDIVALDWMLED